MLQEAARGGSQASGEKARGRQEIAEAAREGREEERERNQKQVTQVVGHLLLYHSNIHSCTKQNQIQLCTLPVYIFICTWKSTSRVFVWTCAAVAVTAVACIQLRQQTLRETK